MASDRDAIMILSAVRLTTTGMQESWMLVQQQFAELLTLR
jgi:hypothetical protein